MKHCSSVGVQIPPRSLVQEGAFDVVVVVVDVVVVVVVVGGSAKHD